MPLQSENFKRTVGIMQPYLFPYLGYFQLINAVDVFVVYDDVQYIKGGWINRNNILSNGEESLFTFSVKQDSTYLTINQRHFSDQFEKEKAKFQKTLQISYARAPHFHRIFSLVSECLIQRENVADSLYHCIQCLCEYMEIKTPIVLSSHYEKQARLSGEARVIELVKLVSGNHYINAIGGQAIYSKQEFEKHGIHLSFIKMNTFTYQQFHHGFVPNLSIIDVLMFNSPQEVSSLLGQYELL